MSNGKYQIKSVKTWVEDLQLTRPYTIAYKTVDAVENAFVQIETGAGITGIGAASPGPYVTGETFEMCQNALQQHAEALLLGKDIREYVNISRTQIEQLPKTPGARAAIDIALFDALAQHYDLPLAKFLGQSHREIPTSITIGIKPNIYETLAEADEYLGRGFRIIKLKIGINVDQDIETTSKLFELVGKKMKIRVDANQGYSPAQLTKYYNATKNLGLDLIEQPVPKEKPELMQEVDAAVRAVCAADESIQSPGDALKLAAQPQPFGIYNIKLMKCGGVYPAMQIAEIARLAGISLMWGCMDESIVSISAALHTAFASPATKYLDLDGSLDLARDIVSGGFTIKDGMMSISDKPGLGVQRL
ncbi:MAG: dipeptide epimerase [Calditrichia bacterium]